MKITEFKESFYNKGFFRINDSKPFDLFPDIETCSWKNLKNQGLQIIFRDNDVESGIKNVHNFLGDNYIRLLDPNFRYGDYCEIVNGMDDATLVWHNDACEGYNLCVLLYFDTLDADIGGKISFREIMSKEKTGDFYPQKFDIAFLNHSTRFEHIVEDMKLPLPRRVASFNFHVNEILTG